MFSFVNCRCFPKTMLWTVIMLLTATGNMYPALAQITALQPNGQIYHPGDSVTIKWVYPDRGQVIFRISLNNGLSFVSGYLFQTKYQPTTDTSQVRWMLPVNASYVSDSALIKVQDYDRPDVYGYSEIFSIKNPSAVKPASRSFVLGKTDRYSRIFICTMSGRVVQSFAQVNSVCPDGALRTVLPPGAYTAVEQNGTRILGVTKIVAP